MLKIEIMKKLIVAMTALISLLSVHHHAPVLGGAALDIAPLLEGKTSKEKADIKSTEIAKLNFAGIYEDTVYGETIEIKSISKIDGGIEIVARAWKGTQQLGFGADGSTEWERFRIINPPILVDDPAGTIIRQWTGSNGILHIRPLREDPILAVRKTLAHTIKVTGKTDTRIIAGSVGHTTLTVFPAAGANSPVDGRVAADYAAGTNKTWTQIQGDAGNASSATVTADSVGQISMDSGTDGFRILVRSIFLFDTSSLGAGASISAATLSLYDQGKADTGTAINPTYNIFTSAPASNNALVNADFTTLGTVAQATAITHANWAANVYNDFTLNATGRGNISLTGISKFGSREATYDAPNSAPTWSASSNHYAQCSYADTAGTAQDPQLVVTYTITEAGGKGLKIIIMSMLEKLISIAWAK